MRLLVHGGTSYSERQRIGEWPGSISSGTLEDLYGVAFGSFAFGLGLIDQNPFLIFRTLHSHRERPYAITILLDPGARIWQEFEWNPAHLLYALFGDPTAPGFELLQKPETYSTKEKLAALLDTVDRTDLSYIPRLKWDAWTPEARQSLAHLWVGAAAIQSAEGVVYPTRFIGCAQRPGYDEVAFLLHDLPVCFRYGKGWLIGGSDIQGESLGAHLVVDDGLAVAPEKVGEVPTQDYFEKGKDILRAWTVVTKKASRIQDAKESEAFCGQWKELMDKPFAEWQEADGFFETFFDDFILLSEALEPSKSLSLDELITRIEERIGEHSRLAPQLRRAAYELILLVDQQHHQRISKAQTKFVVETWGFRQWHPEESRLTPDEAIAEMLDPETLTEELLNLYKGGLTLSQDGVSIKGLLDVIPSRHVINFWSEVIAHAEYTDQLDEELRQAEAFLNAKYKADPRLRDELSDKLIDAAYRRAVSLGFSLTTWRRYENNSRVWSRLAKKLEGEAYNRARTQRTIYWHNDLLLYGNDPGGKNWERERLDPKDSHAAINAYLELIRAEIATQDDTIDTLLAQRARRWLNELASSPLRKKVSLEDKIQISQAGLEGWRNFKLALELYQGGNNGAARSTLDISQDERAALIEELKEKFKSDQGRTDLVPDLLGLSSVFGSNLYFLSGLKPEIAWSDARHWLDGWLRIDERVFESEFLRILINSDEAIPDTYVESVPLDNVFKSLFYAGTPEDDRPYAQAYIKLAKLALSGKLAVKIRSAINNAIKLPDNQRALNLEDPSVRRFLERFKPQTDAWQSLHKFLNHESRDIIDSLRSAIKQSKSDQVVHEISSLLFEGDADQDSQCRHKFREFLMNFGSDPEFQARLEAAVKLARDEEKRAALIHRYRGHAELFNQILNAVPDEERASLEGQRNQAQEEEIRIKVHECLYEESTAYASYRGQLNHCLSKYSDTSALQVIVAEELKKYVAVRNRGHNFWQRYVEDDGKLVGQLFEYISTDEAFQDRLMFEFHKAVGYTDKQQSGFRELAIKQVVNLLRACAGPNPSRDHLTTYQRAVLRYVTEQWPESAEFKRELGEGEFKHQLDSIKREAAQKFAGRKWRSALKALEAAASAEEAGGGRSEGGATTTDDEAGSSKKKAGVVKAVVRKLVDFWNDEEPDADEERETGAAGEESEIDEADVEAEAGDSPKPAAATEPAGALGGLKQKPVKKSSEKKRKRKKR